MESPESLTARLDSDFDQMLASMKPYVLKLPHKSERQRCAQWIKKFCEPPASGISGRKNRNAYSQLLLHMLKRGALEGPFTQRPEAGPLPTLPPYMSIYFDDMKLSSGASSPKQGVPEWVHGELPSDVSSVTSLGLNPAASSTLRHPDSPYRSSSLSPSSKRTLTFDMGSPLATRIPDYRTDYKTDYKENRDALTNGNGPYLNHHRGHTSPTPAGPFPQGHRRLLPDTTHMRPLVVETGIGGLTPPGGVSEDESDENIHETPTAPTVTDLPWRHAATSRDWTKYNSTYTSGVSFRDDSMVRIHERELDMRGKMQEAKFQEEKLKLQQKHDATVQKILDRKNAEIEELKIHYRNKAKELEETISKLDRKVGVLQKESSKALETKNEQIEELKKLAEHTSKSTQNEFEKRLHDAVAEFEQEKFELQKQHTRNIQELLEDTNSRLTRMEEEYAQQSQATSQVIAELESRVQQMTGEAEAMSRLRTQLEQDKTQLQTTVERLQSQHRELQARYNDIEKEHKRAAVEHEQEMRSTRNKHEATVEFLKQEHNIATVKSAEVVSDLEQHITQLKQSIESGEQQRQRQTREMEQMHQQDRMHLEHLHENKIRTMQKELDQLEQASQKDIHKLEHALKDKEEDLRRAVEQQKLTVEQSEKALSEFKTQVERNSTKMYEEMKHQSDRILQDFKTEVETNYQIMADGLRAEMDKVENDLSRSKQLREKQAREFQKQLDVERQGHEQQLSELKISFEQERAQMLRDFHAQKEALYNKCEQEAESVRSSAATQVEESQRRAREKAEQAAKQISELESQVQELREQVVEANQLRRQQLVELGLLREEEKQKMQHDHEAEIARVRSELEQHHLEQEKQHSSAMEEMLQKTNSRLSEIEKEYSTRANRSTETINELQKTIHLLRDDIKSQQQQAEQRLNHTTKRLEEEKQKLKQQHSVTIMELQQEIESQKSKVRQVERNLSQREQEYEEQVTSLRAECEEKTRGLIPASVRQELEDTILSLKSQVSSLQQRAQLLQEEVEIRSAFSSTHHLGNSLATTMGSTASIKSNV